MPEQTGLLVGLGCCEGDHLGGKNNHTVGIQDRMRDRHAGGWYPYDIHRTFRCATPGT